jgi:serine protease Do
MNVSRWRAPIAVVAATAVLGAAGFLFGPAAHRPIEAQWEEGGQAVAPVRTSSSGPDFASLAAAVTPAVVRVETTKQMTEAANMRGAPDDVIPEPFRRFFDMPNQMPDSRGTEPPVALAGGSGFLISSDGYIVTNNHVVEDAQGVRVWLHDGRSYQADIVGTDPTTDVAVIRIHQDHLPFLAWGNSDALRVGDWVMAVGNPGVEGSAPLDYTVTSGIVSAKGRPLGIIRNSLDESGAGSDLSGYAIENFIQTDAVINPGNSGGPLVDTDGHVVGINSAILSTSGYFQGYGFAVPSDLAKHVASDLIDDGHVSRAWLGLTMTAVTSEDAEVYGLPSIEGALVQMVSDDSPADKAGLQQGDVILSVAGTPVRQSGQLQELVAEHNPGDRVAIGIYRGKRERTLEVTLGEMPMRNDKPVAATASADRSPAESRLGLSVMPLNGDLAGRFGFDADTHGLVVTAVDPLGPAGRKGVGPGMRLMEVAGHRVTNERELAQALEGQDAGHAITLLLQDAQGRSRLVNVRLQ